MVMLPLQCIYSTVEQPKGIGGVVVWVGTRNPSTAVLGASVEGCCEKPKDRTSSIESSTPTIARLPVVVLWIQWMQGSGRSGLLGHTSSTPYYPKMAGVGGMMCD